MSSNQMINAILVFCLLPLALIAEERRSDSSVGSNYQIGMRSTFITNTMQLSKLNPAFDDLSRDGLKGAHHSSIYFLRSINPHFRIGFETLTGNSDVDAETSMDFQGGGLLLDFHYNLGRQFFVAGGIHAGGILVDAVHRETEASGKSVQTGTFYKSEGVFLAPSVAIGVNVKRVEFRIVVKPLFMTAVEEGNDMNRFNSTYVGLSHGWNLKP